MQYEIEYILFHRQYAMVYKSVHIHIAVPLDVPFKKRHRVTIRTSYIFISHWFSL